MRLVVLLMTLALASCIKPQISICTTENSCTINAPAHTTVNGVELPKGALP